MTTGLMNAPTRRLAHPPDPLCQRTDLTFGSFMCLPSNMHALESARLFSNRAAPFVALVGPSGWGKTHLLHASSDALRPEFLRSVGVCEAADYAVNPGRRDVHAPLLLDNVQGAFDRSRARLQLRLALERRVRSGRPTLLSFTGSANSAALRSFLPNFKDWMLCHIPVPKAAERELLARQMAKAEGLNLSDCLFWLLATQLAGTGCSLLGALKRLRLHQTQWRDPGMTLRACGVLNPFFADNSGWDLREHIASCAEDFPSECLSIDREDLAIFAMLRIALLAEADVAQYFQIVPAAVYTRAIRFEARVSSPRNCDERADVLRFLRYTIAKLRT